MSGRNLPTATVAKQREKQTRAIRANLFVGQHAFHANRTIHARHQTHRASAKKASSGLVDFLPTAKAGGFLSRMRHVPHSLEGSSRTRGRGWRFTGTFP